MIPNTYNYLPILALSTAEMSALEQLSDKDKDLLLPIFPLKGWLGSKTLDRTLTRIDISIGTRPWIADIDSDFIFNNKKYLNDPDSQREVFREIARLLDPTNGYENWVNFISGLNTVIPTLQTQDLNQIENQIGALSSLNRGLVVRFKIKKDSAEKINAIVRALISCKIKDILIVLDFEDIKRSDVLQSQQYSLLVTKLNKLIPSAIFSISATSFPSSFSGSYRGELPIYERQLHTEVCKLCKNVRVIYSDRGSARANKNNGGGGLPPPRIDYPLRNDWRYVRKEFSDPSSDISESEKHALYKAAAKEIVDSDYWNPHLRLWGVQMIEKTVELRDKYCITSPNRSTAVRINIHLYQQLHYTNNLELLDTEEDWED